MRPVIFLGPSLPLAEAVKHLDATYMPPVKRGDLPALPQGVDAIGIIDGVFMGEAAVGHREILDKLRAGVKVLGGGSMGALRASELKDFGMVGVGKVYELYATGEVEGDDEVALTFNPETLEAMSEPLVNMRINLGAAVARHIITAERMETVLEGVRAIYFPRRTKEALYRVSERMLDEASYHRLRDFFDSSYEDVKKRDAIEVLRALRKSPPMSGKGVLGKRP